MTTLQGYFDFLPPRVQSSGHLRWCEEAFILSGIPAFVTPFVDVPFAVEHRPEVLHSPMVSLLGGSDVVCVGYVAAAEEIPESLRHSRAECQGISSCSFSSLLNFQTMFVCA